MAPSLVASPVPLLVHTVYQATPTTSHQLIVFAKVDGHVQEHRASRAQHLLYPGLGIFDGRSFFAMDSESFGHSDEIRRQKIYAVGRKSTALLAHPDQAQAAVGQAYDSVWQPER